ncbi:DUF4468 domain-containing protein [Pedobacter frigidisoli]|uniref:DUF4468 domain-containing protein n=1 Tax=Pedobacter frigidisoli TaxID=2530455 RepID=A0A4R0NYK9_9SPHI|nr:DUF4468 domain-containing protein [Pedobacter frigidisoli]TCD07119.1 DUF4468 domain-containing protein [Pedobacter frigidisoli]
MKYTLILFLAVFSIKLSAQQKQFPKDDNGKFIYYKVVDSQVLSKKILLERAVSFINDVQKKNLKQETLTDTSITAKGKLVIDKTILVAGHPSGEVSYNFVFEARDGKYRFWLTDFEFIPYKRDRYGNFVASTNIGTPLEKTVSKLSIGEWKDIQSSAYLKAIKFGEELKKYVATEKVNKKTAKAPETISTKKW